jgi:hypothetical protein
VNNKVPLLPCSFTATLPIFFVAMPHIALQKIVDWQQNSGGENGTLLFTSSFSNIKKATLFNRVAFCFMSGLDMLKELLFNVNSGIEINPKLSRAAASAA